MILTDEPVYYKTGEYGIRIENRVLVAPHAMAGAEKEMLCFETLTLAPIDLALVDTALLDEGEKAWLNAYHARSEEHTSELQSLMRISYAVFCLKKKKNNTVHKNPNKSLIRTDNKIHRIHKQQ